jgi:hypothetical protein
MIYIRNLFTQDLRDGKQIAFPTEPSNILFKFSFSNQDSDRKISFKFKEKDNNSPFFQFNGKIINTRIYSAGSESRIDGELKHFLKVDLNAVVDDIVVFRSINITSYEFELIPHGSLFYTVYKALLNGKNHEVVIEHFNFNNDTTLLVDNVDFSNLKEDFADWFIKIDGVNHNYFNRFFGLKRDNLLEQLTKYENIYEEQFGTPIFSLNKIGNQELIDELEENLYLENGPFFQFSLKTSKHMPRAILGKKNYLKFLKELLLKSKTSSAKSPKVAPINKIYFGAPGTGKSFRITEDLKDVDTIFQKRITFHPEYDNSSFVGGYKPITDNKGEIKYEFVPQIFANIYVEACNDPIHQYYLIIEEINRGNCAEIFGELFQLLDRDENYKITPSNELIIFLNESISNSKYYNNGEMLLPDNLSILASMNTSDQSLFPMDSAFKRRWEWEYIPICYNPIDDYKKKNVSFDFEIDIEDGKKYSWIKFIEKINLNHIKVNPSLGMDKCIGNYFIKPDNGNLISLKPFVNKVIFYLWNDVFKDEDNKVFEENTSYEDFFPIETNGKKKIKELFDRIDLKTIPSLEIVDDENPLGQAAESSEET